MTTRIFWFAQRGGDNSDSSSSTNSSTTFKPISLLNSHTSSHLVASHCLPATSSFSNLSSILLFDHFLTIAQICSATVASPLCSFAGSRTGLGVHGYAASNAEWQMSNSAVFMESNNSLRLECIAWEFSFSRDGFKGLSSEYHPPKSIWLLLFIPEEDSSFWRNANCSYSSSAFVKTIKGFEGFVDAKSK